MTSSIGFKLYQSTPLANKYEEAKGRVKAGDFCKLNDLINAFSSPMEYPCMLDDPAACYRISNRMIKVYLAGENLQIDNFYKTLKQLYRHGVFSRIPPQKETVWLCAQRTTVSFNKGLLRFFCKAFRDLKEGETVKLKGSTRALMLLKEILYHGRMEEACEVMSIYDAGALYALSLETGFTELTDHCFQALINKMKEGCPNFATKIAFIEDLNLTEATQDVLKLQALICFLSQRGIPYEFIHNQALLLMPTASISKVQEIFKGNKELCTLVGRFVREFIIEEM